MQMIIIFSLFNCNAHSVFLHCILWHFSKQFNFQNYWKLLVMKTSNMLLRQIQINDENMDFNSYIKFSSKIYLYKILCRWISFKTIWNSCAAKLPMCLFMLIEITQVNYTYRSTCIQVKSFQETCNFIITLLHMVFIENQLNCFTCTFDKSQ